MNERTMKTEEKKQYDVLVIGGGAAGMMAAVTAAANGAHTAVIEHKDRVGKKILSTGNGKCNYTNALQGVTYYRGEDPAFVLPVMEQFGFEETVAFFKELGIYPKVRNGYYYPASEQAASVLDVLRLELAYQKVDVYTECELTQLYKKRELFYAETKEQTFLAGTVIFATGLLAAEKTGSDGSAIPFIKEFGHRFAEIVPALVALQCQEGFFKQLAGIRTEAGIRLMIDGACVVEETGELQLTDYGISGIPVFQVSRFATKALKRKQKVTASIDLFPALSKEELYHVLEKRFGENAHGKTAQEAVIGLWNKKLGEVLLKESNISLTGFADRVERKKLHELADRCKCFHVTVTGSKPFEQAQVCAGGVYTKDIRPETMESLLEPGLYFAGEVVDIDGMCGGYNLQWAWSSGHVAGKSAAQAAVQLHLHKKEKIREKNAKDQSDKNAPGRGRSAVGRKDRKNSESKKRPDKKGHYR